MTPLWAGACPPAVEALLPRLLSLQTVHGGRDASGVDCAGLPRYLYSLLDPPIDLPLPASYPLDWYLVTPRRAVLHMDHVARWPLATPPYLPMDLAMFNLTDPRCPTSPGQHFGVHLGGGRIIHAQRRVVIEALGACQRPATLREVYRPPAS